jgi:DNA-binding IclR family transcriptional regulator
MIAHSHLITCALDEMHRLRDISGETVALQIFAGIKRIFLEVVPSLQQIKHTEEKGSTVPIYAGSAGRVMLAELSQKDLSKIIRLVKVVDPIPDILKNEGEFLKELEKIRAQGYAVTYSTRIQGGAAISLPIRNYTCPVAISIFGPEVRFKYPLIVLEEIRRSADIISNRLLSLQ